MPSAKYHTVLAVATPSASCPARKPSKYMARSATTRFPLVCDSMNVENSALSRAGCSSRGQNVTRPLAGASSSLTYSAPVAVRYVARTRVVDGLGLATSTNVSKMVVAPSARVQLAAACVTPLALWAPGRVPSGKYIVRSTTMSAGVLVPWMTALTRAELLPFSWKSAARRTVRRAVGPRVKTFVSRGAMASNCGSSVTVTSSVWLDGLPTRISLVKVALLAPSARNQVSAPCARAAMGWSSMRSPAHQAAMARRGMCSPPLTSTRAMSDAVGRCIV